MSTKDKWVRRFSVNETAKHKSGFTIYKITSVLFPLESPEAVSVVSVWKRYSDAQRLHASLRALHAGLHLRGVFPHLPRHSYFKRFQHQVIQERAKSIKTLLEFVAEHKLLFTSTDFVNFLQTGYPEPEGSSSSSGGVINAIRSSLHLPLEETPPLEYRAGAGAGAGANTDTDDDDSRSPAHAENPQPSSSTIDETDLISQIPIYEPADVELPTPKESPKNHKHSKYDSFESLNSLDSISSDLYSELDKVAIQKSKPCVKKAVLPDLISFDVPSTSKFDDYHTMTRTNSDTTSLSSTVCDSEDKRSASRVSLQSKMSTLSLSNVECKTKTEDSYVFEAGYMLNLAARYEDMREYHRAFDCYKAGIEKMLIGVQSDTDPQRRALIKEKTNKYLSYAEAIYKNHLCDAEQTLLPEREERSRSRWLHAPMPLSMVSRPYAELSRYRVLRVLAACTVLALHRADQTCCAIKVIQKVPKNLTEFDEYFLQNTQETRQPILPTVIPYMVPLQAYIQTNNLIFLILAYAPGEKLFDYIKNHAKSVPNTPAREVNLENVFTEPKIKINDIENDNLDSIIEIKDLNVDLNVEADSEDVNMTIIERIEANIENNNKNVEVKTEDLDNVDVSVKELVKNSQKLLLNVDKVLSGSPTVKEPVQSTEEKTNTPVVKDDPIERRIEAPSCNRPSGAGVSLPAGTVCQWGAEILTALESLHNCGVICRDLNPSNILLGKCGQIILTYFLSYPGLDMTLAKLRAKPGLDMYIAPELYLNTYIQEKDDSLDRVCDFWSFGAIMYELLCGVPLSYHHRSMFTSHTLLQLPDQLPLEARSLLTQLLTFSPAERLGAGPDGIEEIKRHPYFKRIHWQQVYDNWIVPD